MDNIEVALDKVGGKLRKLQKMICSVQAVEATGGKNILEMDVQQQLGAILFAVVSVSWVMGVDPEQALLQAASKPQI